jgi:acyl-CoA synthetase (AMP-forming)/AMP-acid ligase II
MANFSAQNKSIFFAISEQQQQNSSNLNMTKALATGKKVSSVNQPKTPVEALRKFLELYPDGKFIYIQGDGEEAIQTYQQTWVIAKNILAKLQRQEIKIGSSIILQLENPFDFIACFWSCIMGGFVPVPTKLIVNQSSSTHKVNQFTEVFYSLNHPLILTTEKFIEPLSSILNLKNREKLVTIDCLEKETNNVNLYYHKPEDWGFFLLSSGTTGKPKIITFNSATLIFRLLRTRENQDQVFLNWLPLEHIGGLRTVIPNAPLKIYLATNAFLENPLLWLDLIEKYRVTNANSVNFALALIIESLQKSSPKRWDLSSIREIGIGAETIIQQTLHNFLAHLSCHGLQSNVLRPGYGMSECGVIAHNDKVKTATNGGMFVEVGKPAPGHKIRIVNEDNQLLSENEIGRIQVIGASMTSGYYQNQELNQNLFTPDGWINTGDLGFLDHGFLTVTGREKEQLLDNGFLNKLDKNRLCL